MTSGPRLVVALDFSDKEQCLALAEQLNPRHCRLKVGKELFTRFGPALVESLQNKGFDVFLDLKYHDIPNTVAKAISAAASLGVWMVNVHAAGGVRMLSAAREALEPYQNKPLLIAVTVLTSLDQEDLNEMGISTPIPELVSRYSAVANKCGLDGVVCSAQEAGGLKSSFGEGFTTVTPGIRPANAEVGDQRRVLTPAQAVKSGSDYLVVGRPITQASVPAEASLVIAQEIHEASR